MTERDCQPQLLPRDAYEILPIDKSGVVTQGVPCLECGYILRGMNVSQACPECGTPIARSLRSLLLRFGDTTWLELIRTGMVLITVFIVLNALIPLDMVERAFQDDPLAAPALWIMMMFVTGTFVLGQWMLTVAEPTGMLSHREDRLRTAIRVLTILAAGLLLVHDAMVTRAGLTIEAPIILGVTLLMLGAILATGSFVRGIADRVPDEELRKATTVTVIGFVVCLASYAMTILWMAASRTSVGQLRTVNIITLLGQPYGQSAVAAVFWFIAITAAVSTVGVVAVTLGYRAAIRDAIAKTSYRATSPEEEAAIDTAEDAARDGLASENTERQMQDEKN
jgi:hypothetical protein